MDVAEQWILCDEAVDPRSWWDGAKAVLLTVVMTSKETFLSGVEWLSALMCGAV
jgi:hypothetical protein